MDPMLAVIQAQLARQKAEHATAMAALKATVDAQQVQLAAQLLRAFVFSVKAEMTKCVAGFRGDGRSARPYVDFSLLGPPPESPSAKGGHVAASAGGGVPGAAGISAPMAVSPIAPVTPTVPEKHRQSDADIEAAVKGNDIFAGAAEFSGRNLFTRLAPVRLDSGVHRGLDFKAAG
ncbi:hypothetical protein CYMTET_54106 [Cymbomonas tetramitiformis]|uniref:Uncharacterized protein n=1 Tax=Cymbomonas tetramitiformis TaxID=36881 RepID=A0AAE0BHF6_9CHLO|nr:hypothetical protein CYMTET_54106 [Cymbomonas tetramitiformis]